MSRLNLAKLLKDAAALETQFRPKAKPVPLIWGVNIDWLPPDAAPGPQPPQRLTYEPQKLLPPPPADRYAAAGAVIEAPRDNPPKGDAYA